MGNSLYNLGISVLILLGFLIFIVRFVGDAVQVAGYHADCRSIGVSGQAADAPCHAEADQGIVDAHSMHAYIGSRYTAPHPAYTKYDLTFRLHNGQEVTEPVPSEWDGDTLPMSQLYTLTIWKGRVTQIREGDARAEPQETRDSPATDQYRDGGLALVFTALLVGAGIYWKNVGSKPDADGF